MHEPWTLLRDVVQGVSGVLMLALGAFVGSVRPRTTTTLAFAAFACAFGLSYVTLNVFDLAHGDLLESAGAAMLLAGLWTITGIAALALAVGTPRPLARAEARLVALPLAVAAANMATTLLDLPLIQGDRPFVLHLAESFSDSVVFALLTLLALRFRREADPATRTQVALVSGGFLAYYAYWPARNVGAVLLGSGAPLALWTPYVELAASLLVGAIYLAGTRGPGGRTARDLALFVFGLALLGAISPLLPDEAGISGYLRIGMVAIVAYGIARHRILGIDAKVRFAISKGTLAAAFIAAFFVASEGAQILFGGGNEWVGLLAAGALVFAMAPLQRAAERLAERAVPTAPPIEGAPASSASETYRILVSRMLKDGAIDRREERALAYAATALGLTPQEALALRHEAEDARAVPAAGEAG